MTLLFERLPIDIKIELCKYSSEYLNICKNVSKVNNYKKQIKYIKLYRYSIVILNLFNVYLLIRYENLLFYAGCILLIFFDYCVKRKFNKWYKFDSKIGYRFMSISFKDF